MNHPAHERSRLRVLTKLRAEHQDLLFLFAVYAAHPNNRQGLLGLIHTMNHLHYAAEIGVFYPAVLDLSTGGEMLNDAGQG